MALIAHSGQLYLQFQYIWWRHDTWEIVGSNISMCLFADVTIKRKCRKSIIFRYDLSDVSAKTKSLLTMRSCQSAFSPNVCSSYSSYTVGPIIIEFRWYWIITIWLFISQLVDNIRTKMTRDARYYLQELNRSFEMSFGPQADRLQCFFFRRIIGYNRFFL